MRNKGKMAANENQIKIKYFDSKLLKLKGEK